MILHEEDPADRFFILTSGRGRRFTLTGTGKKILLDWLTAGQMLGSATVLSTPMRYIASTELLSNSCALMWDRKKIRELVGQYPTLLDNVLSIVVTEHVAWLMAAHISLSTNNAQTRIAQLLVSLASAIGKVGSGGVEIPVGNQDLAESANVTPFTVSRTLTEWQREGVLTKGRGKLLLRKPELLLLHVDGRRPLHRLLVDSVVPE